MKKFNMFNESNDFQIEKGKTYLMVSASPYWDISWENKKIKITYVGYDDYGGRIVYFTRVDDGKKSSSYYRPLKGSIIPLDDFEESNYEEWIEESKGYKFKKDDRAIYSGRIPFKSDSFILKDTQCTIIDPGLGGIFIFVKFDKNTKLDDKQKKYYVYSDFLKPIDDYETSNYEEWVEESKWDDEPYCLDKKGNRLYRGDKIIYNFPNTNFPLANNQVGIIISIYDDDSCEIEFEKNVHSESEFVLKIETCPNQSCTKYVEDIPEETNYEEWLEENLKHKKYTKGTKVIYKGSRYGNNSTILDGEVGIISSVINFGSVWADYYIIFSKYPPSARKPKHWRFIIGNKFMVEECEIESIDDYETSNYEEWVEESKQNNFKIGDLVKINNIGKDERRYGLIGYITSKLTSDMWTIQIIKGNKYYYVNWFISSHYRNLELSDDFEETNYEEWVDESNQYKFKIGDRVVVNCLFDFIVNKKGVIVDIYDPDKNWYSKSKDIN
jgi:hypothetical protein